MPSEDATTTETSLAKYLSKLDALRAELRKQEDTTPNTRPAPRRRAPRRRAQAGERPAPAARRQGADPPHPPAHQPAPDRDGAAARGRRAAGAGRPHRPPPVPGHPAPPLMKERRRNLGRLGGVGLTETPMSLRVSSAPSLQASQRSADAEAGAAVRVLRPRRAAPADAVRPTRAEVNLAHLRHNLRVLERAASARPGPASPRRSGACSRPTPTATARPRWRARWSARASRASASRCSRRPSSCAPPASARRSS